MNGFWNLEWKLGKISPTVAIQSKFMRSNDYFIKFHMSPLQYQIEILCCQINIKGNKLNCTAGKIS